MQSERVFVRQLHVGSEGRILPIERIAQPLGIGTVRFVKPEVLLHLVQNRYGLLVVTCRQNYQALVLVEQSGCRQMPYVD